LRGLNDQVASEGEVGFLSPLHVFRRGLRERCDQDWQCDRRVAGNVSGMRAAREFSVNQSFIKRHGIRSATGMWSVSRDLDRVLVAVMMLFLHERRQRGLLNKTLRCSTAEIQDA